MFYFIVMSCFTVTLSVVMLDAIMLLTTVILGVVMMNFIVLLSTVMLSVIMLNAVVQNVDLHNAIKLLVTLVS